MRPDVKHDSSLTWDLLVARPLSACTSDENKKLLIRRKDNPLVCLFLCEAFISSFYFVLFPPLTCQSQLPLHFVCMYYILVFLPFVSPPFWIRWRESKASASLQQLLAAWVCQRPWKVGRVTLTQSHMACRDQDLEKSGCCGETQHNHSWEFLTPRWGGSLV